MSDFPELPSDFIQLGSSIHSTPTYNNGGILPSSDQPNLSSPTRQPETSPFQQIFQPNAMDEGFNAGNPFQATMTPKNFSATGHRPNYNPSKRTNPSYNFLPSTKYSKVSEPRTPEEALEQSRTFLCKAIEMQHNQAIKINLMNLLNVFRDHTEGNPITHAANSLANTVQHMEQLARKLPKITSNNLSKHNNPTTIATAPSNQGLAASLFNTQGGSQDISPSNKPTPKQRQALRAKAKKAKRLILTKLSEEAFSNLNPLKLRNEINQILTAQLKTPPVVSTISRTLTKNLVITTTEDFNAKFLLQHTDLWKHLIAYKDLKEDIQHYKVIIHGIPITEFDREGGMDLIKTEISTFNKGYQVVGTPYWLTSQTKRADPNQYKGSVVIAFEKEEDAQRAIRQRLMVAGISARVVKLYSTSPNTQCTKCCGYGHLPNYCKKDPICILCAGNHPVEQHHCETCNTTGKPCLHTKPLCTSCGEQQYANHKDCSSRPTYNNGNWA